MTRLLPRLHRILLTLNRYFAVPALRAGLGPVLATPWTGSLMVLRTRGRRSGQWRDAPLGYVIMDGSVYCCAGFGPGTSWLRNLQANPRVELVLPGRSVAGEAQVVADPDEQEDAMRALLGSMSWIAGPMLGDPRAAPRERILAMARALPLVRVRVTGLAPGPWDPGGSGWVLSTGLAGLLVGWRAWRFLRARRRR